MVICSAPGCKHSFTNCALFRFPSDAVRRKVWIKNCGRSFATTTHRLCKHHFKKHFIQKRGTRKILAKNAIPTIFQNSNSPNRNRNHQLKKMRSEKVNHEINSSEALNSVFHLKINDCWSKKQKDEVIRKFPDAMYKDSNPLDDDILAESNIRKTNNQSLGLENIPIVGSDISSESSIEFSYSTPRNLNDLSPFLAKWSPKVNNVVSIIEDLIDSSDNDNDVSDEETGSNHVVYIDEDLVKQEEFVDENSEESFDCESNKSSRKDKEELNSSFDQEKVKKEFHITDTLRIRLPKLNITGKSINVRDSNLISLPTTREIMSKEKITSSSNKHKKLLNKTIFSRKSSRNHKTSQSNQRRRSSTSNTKRSTSPELKSQNKIRNRSSNNRQSLRLSGKSPEIKLPDYVPLITRSGKKRIYEEPKNRSTNPPIYIIDDKEVPSRVSKSPVLDESKSEDMLRSRSPSPSTYRKNVEVFFVCQCCDKKYDSVERVKVHVRTHFPHCTTN